MSPRWWAFRRTDRDPRLVHAGGSGGHPGIRDIGSPVVRFPVLAHGQRGGRPNEQDLRGWWNDFEEMLEDTKKEDDSEEETEE